jgi:hypothetical protein
MPPEPLERALPLVPVLGEPPCDECESALLELQPATASSAAAETMKRYLMAIGRRR